MINVALFLWMRFAEIPGSKIFLFWALIFLSKYSLWSNTFAKDPLFKPRLDPVVYCLWFRILIDKLSAPNLEFNLLVLAFCWVIRVGSPRLIWLSSGLASLAFRFLIGLMAAACGKLAKNLKCFGYVLSAMANSSRKISKALGSCLRVSIISGIFLTVYFWASSA